MRIITAAVLACCLTAGCGGGSGKGPAKAQVSGTVLLDNQPMGGGEIRFSLPGEVPQSLEIKGGAFSGPVNIGKNRVEVVWDKDGPPNPTDPKAAPVRVNAVSDKYSGPNSPFTVDVDSGGKSDLKFEVKSARK